MAEEATQGQAEAGETAERRGTGGVLHQHQLSSDGSVVSSISSAMVGQASTALRVLHHVGGHGRGQQDRVAPRIQAGPGSVAFAHYGKQAAWDGHAGRLPRGCVRRRAARSWLLHVHRVASQLWDRGEAGRWGGGTACRQR